MFVANTNDADEKKITLIYPVVARYVRFNPQRWNMVISLRVEITGCAYGNGYNFWGFVVVCSKVLQVNPYFIFKMA